MILHMLELYQTLYQIDHRFLKSDVLFCTLYYSILFDTNIIYIPIHIHTYLCIPIHTNTHQYIPIHTDTYQHKKCYNCYQQESNLWFFIYTSYTKRSTKLTTDFWNSMSRFVIYTFFTLLTSILGWTHPECMLCIKWITILQLQSHNNFLLQLKKQYIP